MLGKNDLRSINRKKRLNLSKEMVRDCSLKLCANLCDYTEYKEADCVLFYAAIQNEIELDPLMEDALKTGKHVYLPKTFGDDMIFYRIQSLNELVPGQFGVPEPTNFDCPYDEGDAVCFVPGVAFSKSGHRIGYGKGYYDRFLSSFVQIHSVGVGFHFQFESDFEAEPHDVKLDILFSEIGLEKGNENGFREPL